MRRLVLVALVPVLLTTAPAPGEEPLVRKVRTALDKGTSYLKAKQKEAGVEGTPKTSVYEIVEFKMYG